MIFPHRVTPVFCCCCGLLNPRAWCRRYVCLMVCMLLLFQRSAYCSQCVWIRLSYGVYVAPFSAVGLPFTVRVDNKWQHE
jgi:hypothetical protein